VNPLRSHRTRRLVYVVAVLLVAALPILTEPLRVPAGIVVGPVFENTLLARFWDVRGEPRPDSVVVSKSGFERRHLTWADPRDQEQYDGMRFDVRWIDSAQGRWPTVSACQLLRELDTETQSLEMMNDWDTSDLTQGVCPLGDSLHGAFVYSVRRFPQRCGREVFVVARYPFESPSEEFDFTSLRKELFRADRNVRVLKQNFAGRAELLPSPECLARESLWSKVVFFGMTCGAALAFASTIWLRSRTTLVVKSIAERTAHPKRVDKSWLWWKPKVLIVEPVESIRRELLTRLASHGFPSAAYCDLNDLLMAPSGLATAHTVLISEASVAEFARSERTIHQLDPAVHVIGVVPDACDAPDHAMFAHSVLFSRTGFTMSSLFEHCRAVADKVAEDVRTKLPS
jgi:hypothetical protein